MLIDLNSKAPPQFEPDPKKNRNTTYPDLKRWLYLGALFLLIFLVCGWRLFVFMDTHWERFHQGAVLEGWR